MTDSVNPIRKRRAVVVSSPWESWRTQLRSEQWYAVCPQCGEEVHDRTQYDIRSTRKRAKDALYRHLRSHEPSSVDTATTCNA